MDKFYTWVAQKLPNKIVYFCAIRVWAYATTTPYDKTHPSQIRVITALKRWENDNA